MATEFVDLEKYKISRYDEEKNKYFYYQEILNGISLLMEKYMMN